MKVHYGLLNKWVKGIEYSKKGAMSVNGKNVNAYRVYAKINNLKSFLALLEGRELSKLVTPIEENTELFCKQYENGVLDFGVVETENGRKKVWTSNPATVKKELHIDCYADVGISGGGRLINVLVQDLISLLDKEHCMIYHNNTFIVVDSIDTKEKVELSDNNRQIEINKVIYYKPILSERTGRIVNFRDWINSLRNNPCLLAEHSGIVRYFKYNYEHDTPIAIKEEAPLLVGVDSNKGVLSRSKINGYLDSGYALCYKEDVVQLKDLMNLDIEKENVVEVDKTEKSKYKVKSFMCFEDEGIRYSPPVIVIDYANKVKSEYLGLI